MNENENKNQNIKDDDYLPESGPTRRSAPAAPPAKQGGSYTVRRVVRPGMRPKSQMPVNDPTPPAPKQTAPQPQTPQAKPVAPAPQQQAAPQAQPRPTVQQSKPAAPASQAGQIKMTPPASRPAPTSVPAPDETALHKIVEPIPQPTSPTRIVTREKKKKSSGGGSGFSSIIKALVYIVCVVGVSIVIAYFGIIISNDVFAFVKEDDETTVTIPEYMTTGELADILYEEGIIKYPFVFKIYCGRNDNGKLEFVPGEYTVNANTSYDKLFTMFQKSTKRETVRIAFPEGLTVDEIIDLLVENGVGTRDGFVEVINEYDFLGAGYEYPFLEQLVITPERHYRLEGYLYPDTYDFYKSRELTEEDVEESGIYIYADEAAAIAKFLNRFKQVFTEDLLLRVEELDMTLDEVITLASIIEKEGKFVVEFENISSVFHNRLNHKGTYPKLQSDATTAYAIQCAEGKRPEEILPSHNDFDHPYNTYVYDGLPPSAIANPGYNAITCALYPSTTEYYFFVSKKDGTTLFAKTEEEHLENIVIARSEQAS